MTKAEWRARMRRVVELIPENVWREAGHVVRQRLMALDAVRGARTVALYLARADEVPTAELAQVFQMDRKRLCVPAYDEEGAVYRWALWGSETAMKLGPWGIPEPERPRFLEDTEPDCILIPGLAFDRRGYRLGRGGGHYDRLLAGSRGFSVGLGVEAQRVDRLPIEAHDVRLHLVVTEKGEYPESAVDRSLTD